MDNKEQEIRVYLESGWLADPNVPDDDSSDILSVDVLEGPHQGHNIQIITYLTTCRQYFITAQCSCGAIWMNSANGCKHHTREKMGDPELRAVVKHAFKQAVLYHRRRGDGGLIATVIQDIKESSDAASNRSA